MLPKLGLIVGDACQVDDAIKKSETRELSTDYGPVLVKMTEKWAVICRSGFSGSYRMPHEYNTAAYLAACQALGLTQVVGVHSTGSLRPSLKPGMLVIPCDWINLSSNESVLSGARSLINPSFSSRVRQNLIDAAWKAKVEFENGGTYWQTGGSRLETKAEVKFMSNFADLVGKSMAREAEIAQEMNLEYGAVCSVDHYANGLGRPILGDEEIWDRCAKSSGVITTLLSHYPEQDTHTLF